MGQSTFRVTYWGVTGSFARPLLPSDVTEKVVRSLVELARCGALSGFDHASATPEQLRALVERHVPPHVYSTYGGNTTCLTIETPEELLIVDAGSGLRDLGIELARQWGQPGYAGPRSGHLLLTHAHFDHTFGTPFFDPFYDGRNSFTVRGPQTAIASLNNMLSPTSEFNGIYHPASYFHLQGIKELLTLTPGDELSIGQTRIATTELRHPGGAVGYRIERDGRRIVIATDHEQTQPVDEGLAEFARGADLLYADAQYLQAEYDGRQGMPGEPPLDRHGWGHSSVEVCVATAAAAGVRALHLGHREPKHDDDRLSDVEQMAQALMRQTLSAAGRAADECAVLLPRERMTFEI